MHVEAESDFESLVQAVRARKLVEPAIFMLEMCKPLTGCAREFYKVSEPLIQLFFKHTLGPAIDRVLSSSQNVELLIRRLEDTRGRGA
jgi:hypothetical protein